MDQPNPTRGIEKGRSTTASGQRAVAVGGPVSQSVIFRGDITLVVGERWFNGVLTLGKWEREDRRLP